MLFDIYGTLLKSDAGEIHPDPALRAEIAKAHADSPYPFPEVDIREIHAALQPGRSAKEIEEMAMAVERESNPVSAMEGARETLHALKDGGLRMGLISNAQFYTVPVFEACLGETLADLGISPTLCCFSYLERRAKPDPWLFEAVREKLGAMGIGAHQALYVGNDVRNDIDPARASGFRTVLFAGDGASLRLRGRSVEESGADHVVHDLREILKLVSPKRAALP